MGSEPADEATVNGDGTKGPYEKFFTSTATSLIVPARATSHPEAQNPSHLDHLHMDRYVPVVFFYHIDGEEAYIRAVARLKASLAEALVTYYPLAGRVFKTDDLDHPRKFVFNDLGMPFTEAVVDKEMSSVFDVGDFKPTTYLSGFEPAGLYSFKQVQSYHEDGIVPAFVQVTRFKCGAVVVGFSWNHLLADMTGAVQFLTAWADISRTGSTAIVPDHNRELLTAARPPPPAVAVVSADEATKIQAVLQAKYEVATLHVRRAAVAELKAEAVREFPEVTTMDCLSAHLWRSLARAYSATGVTDVTAFTTAVEGRSRMGITPSYFGNLVTSAPVMGVPAAAILSQPLGYAASLVRKAVQGITKDTYRNIIEQMDLRNPWKTSINRTDYQLGLTSWIRFGINAVDFGFQKPRHVRVNLPPCNSRKGQCIVQPSGIAEGEGDYFVTMYVLPNIAKALRDDPDFRSVS